MKSFLAILLCLGLIGCETAREKPAAVQEADREAKLSPLARELREAFRETNAFERNDKLAVIMKHLKEEDRPMLDLFDEVVSQPTKAGWDVIRYSMAQNEFKKINVRIPDSYDPKKPTPVVICYHPSGGDGFSIVNEVRRKLGDIVEDFILVGPDGMDPLNIDSQRSSRPQVRVILRELRTRYNVDSDRVYAIGFSLGGYAVWSTSAYFGDDFASGISMGSSFDAAPEIPGMWEALLPNTKDMPVLYVWGDQDELQIYGIDLRTQVGPIGKFNPRITELSKKFGLPHEPSFLKGVGHEFNPPLDRSREFLSKKRSGPPQEIHRQFRTLNQGRAFWIEALGAEGPQWHYEGVPVEYEAPETKEQAIGRILTGLLARIDAKRDGNAITVNTKGLGDLAVWFTEDMIDWEKPVKISWNGKEVFNDKLAKSEEICLLQYVRTRDRQRLYWAGVRLSTRTGVSAITAKEDVPNMVARRPQKAT